MGGSGGGFNVTPGDVREFQKQIRERVEQQKLDADVNSFLRSELLDANDRNADLVNTRIAEIEAALGDQVDEFDDLRFGGSIAKHTYVEGISDTDLLVVIDEGSLSDQSPDDFHRDFETCLRKSLVASDIKEIRVGKLAVTIEYRDGAEIQLLPAIRRGDLISIPTADGSAWQHGIDPKAFTDKLTRANKAQGGVLVPVIKLAKEILASQVPGNRQPSGYHVEALALKAFDGYDGPRTPKAMLQRFFDESSKNIMSPLGDVTGQSNAIDGDLGPAGSRVRNRISAELSNIAEKMRSSGSVEAWMKLFGL